jgi:glycogen debranching enzyme
MTMTLVRPDILYGWKGPSLFIANTRGECGADQAVSGYYFREARFVRTLRFEIDGDRPWLCEAATVEPHILSFHYTHPEIAAYGGGGTGQADDGFPTNERGIPQRALSIRLLYIVTLTGLTVRLTLMNHSRRRVACELAWQVGTDFADIQEAQSGGREQEAPVETEPAAAALLFHYRHPELRYRSAVTALGDSSWTITESRISTRLDLQSQQSIELGLRVDGSSPDGTRLATEENDEKERERRLQDWRDGFTQLAAASNRTAEAIVTANLRDFASFPLLEGRPDEWLALQAGMPSYPALFGRDTLTAGWQAAWVEGGQTLDASLTRLSRLQSDRDDEWHDEQPGRIPYQVRRGPLALLNINPYAAYYADYASPFMFVIGLGHLYAWSGDKAIVRRHWDTARRIMDWAQTYGDADHDGYLEYQTRSSKGTKNQGWKDSGDAIIYEDGTPVPAPLGTCELQGYWFAAQQLMAVLSLVLGSRGDARGHWRSAMQLKQRFNRDWWIDDVHCVALALDPQKRPVPAVSSNIGHCIASGIVSAAHLPAAVERLFAPDMFSGWGIRTLSALHGSYNPLSYHCGTVWAVEQATIAFGLRRFGFDQRALELTKAVFDLAQLYPGYRIPECVGGDAREARPTPGSYPHSNTPQLWNATVFPLLVHTMLGLQPLAPLNTLVVAPALPAWLPEIVLTGLRIGDATATVRFWRGEKGRSHAEILEKKGPLHLIHQQPPESLAAGPWDRFRALLDTVIH